MDITFELPGTPPGQNAQHGQHWAVTARSNREWQGWTVTACREAMRRAAPLGAPKIAFPWPAGLIALEFRFSRSTRRDLPNLAAAAKPIVDGIVLAGLLPDDSYIYLHGFAVSVQRKLAGQPSVLVTVRRAEALPPA